MDPTLYKTVLDFNHRIERRAMLLLPVVSGTDSLVSIDALPVASSTASLDNELGRTNSPPVQLSTPEDLARYIDQLANSVMK